MVSDPDTVSFPPIALCELPEATKDFILASCLDGTPPQEVIKNVLRAAATDAGFCPEKAA
jgi:hypothetical protein